MTLLAFLVDILLFVPHLQWGGWIVLASTILITASGVVTCAMRRTLVSRKARKKRIAENAEMSGENFYNRQNTQAKMDAISPISTGEPKVPMVNGAPGSNSLPTFATFTKEHDPSEGRSDFSRITPTNRMASEPMGEGLGPTRSRSHDRYRGVTDEFGGPIPSSNAVGGVPPHLRRDPSDPSLRQMPSWDRVNELPPRGGFGYGGPRGRGGYPARGGYGPPRGGFTGPRGGPGQGFGRGAFNDGRGNYYNGRGRGSAVASGYMGRPGPGPPPGYPPQGQGISPERYGSQEESSRRPSQGSGSASSGPRQQSPGTPLRRPSPGMAPPSTQDHYFVGQAVEMNASTGRISQAGGRAEEGEAVHRMITVPENHSGIPPDQASPSSQYSSAEAPRPPFAATQQNMSNTSSMYSNPPE